MKALCALLLLSALPAMGQSSKSVEAIDTEQQSHVERQRLDAQEDRQVRREWDKEENQAKRRAEEQRQLDLQRAEDFGPYQQSSQRP